MLAVELVELEVRCTVGACGLCVERQCTARLDGVIPGNLDCPGYLAHRMVDSEAVLRLRRGGYQPATGWWPMSAAGAGGRANDLGTVPSGLLN